jgi:hypothetical protein
MFFLQYLACLCQIAACLLGSDELQELANCISWISDLVYCSVCACMQVNVFASKRTRISPPKVFSPKGGGFPVFLLLWVCSDAWIFFGRSLFAAPQTGSVRRLLQVRH